MPLSRISEASDPLDSWSSTGSGQEMTSHVSLEGHPPESSRSTADLSTSSTNDVLPVAKTKTSNLPERIKLEENVYVGFPEASDQSMNSGLRGKLRKGRQVFNGYENNDSTINSATSDVSIVESHRKDVVGHSSSYTDVTVISEEKTRQSSRRNKVHPLQRSGSSRSS